MPVPNDVAGQMYTWLVNETAKVLSPNAPSTEAVPPGGGPPVGDPGADVNTGGGGTRLPDTPGGTDYPWSGIKQFNPTYPFAIWGGKDNFDAQKAPDWMVSMVDDALKMTGAERDARILHILSTTKGMPDYLQKYLHSRLDNPG